MRKFLIVLLVLQALFVSCNENDDRAEAVEFDESHPLAISPNVDWAVVTEPYVGFREEAYSESAASSYCRKGEILQVKGFSINDKGEGWYLFDRGWMPAASLTVYQNRYKAESAVRLDSAR